MRNKIICCFLPGLVNDKTSERISKLEKQLTLTAESVKKLDETISALEQERTDTVSEKDLIGR
ncbi:hypothetical protein SARC_00690 [Sphaeroforma arctica JP610]|uniref:Uncharacterized protein n=1 Tax=Sphaeroforma arctica JP610 TaxID=667725 RepID=A0A0L0GDS5_9EUKA|nr:hypothetical protein SARC_00690 [Sphaeroforma arctica JP610]KNC87162.1 hypothetical protein SARC_00690 [Sphaeroforma arctica JP610]|eukprot:XP_014161064.1 hypothetical protein SARC_00690 [Sphaeroforma arctica JP610]